MIEKSNYLKQILLEYSTTNEYNMTYLLNTLDFNTQYHRSYIHQ